jgi:subtilisin-like proprotein convertase family protein
MMDFAKSTSTGVNSRFGNNRVVTAMSLMSCVGILAGLSNALEIEPATSVSSIAASTKTAENLDHIASGNIIVYTNDAEALKQAVNSLGGVIAGVELVMPLGNDGNVFLVATPSKETAVSVRKIILNESSVTAANLDFRRTPRNETPGFDRIERRRVQAPGIEVFPQDGSNQRGGTDPIDQWHHVNTLIPGADNNIVDSIYTTDLLTGSGVTIGFANQGFNTHIQTDHSDLSSNYRLDQSSPFDPLLFTDDFSMTAWAGISNALRDNGIGGHGVAPSAEFVTFNFNETDLVEFNAYNYLNNIVDIKVFPLTAEYSSNNGSYADNLPQNFITDAQTNSIVFGRNRKGIVNLYNAGTNPFAPFVAFRMPEVPFPTFPDPYNFPPAGSTFSPTDDMVSNEVSVSLTNGFSAGPSYVNGNLGNYPPANNRRVMIINAVGEDGHYDVFSAQGPAMFASVYAGTTNLHQVRFANEVGMASITPPRGVITTTPSNGNLEFPTPADAIPFNDENTSATAITAGIIALMLESNPKLSVRDIQHIFFESIQESTKAPSIKWPNFSSSREYYVPEAPFISRSFWQVNAGLYNTETITNQAIRHSDNYGFGIIDAELAIMKAATWPGTPNLILLDTGIVGEVAGEDDDDVGLESQVPFELNDAIFTELSPADGATGTPGVSVLTPGAIGGNFIELCVRQNIQIESIVLELTLTGNSMNDLYIELESPNGTRSIMSLPQTANLSGTSFALNPTDDDSDNGPFQAVAGFALSQHPYLSWKHWGELSGGEWQIRLQDYGPDEETPEGEEADADPMGDPGADMITTLGEIGVPGSNFRDDKELIAFRLKIYGTDVGAPIFEGCSPFETSCPGDLDANGIINVADLQIFLSWYTSGNALADINGDGTISFNDLITYRTLWIPGYCDDNGNPFLGGRPLPGSNNGGSDTNPIILPI